MSVHQGTLGTWGHTVFALDPGYWRHNPWMLNTLYLPYNYHTVAQFAIAHVALYHTLCIHNTMLRS